MLSAGRVGAGQNSRVNLTTLEFFSTCPFFRIWADLFATPFRTRLPDQTVQMLQSTLTSGTLSSMKPIPDYQLSAKTGTAQVADRPGGGYGNDFITSVAGMIPSVNPQYVVMVTMTKPTKNKTSAGVGPAFRAITSDVIQHYYIQPTTNPRPNFPVTW